MTPVPPDAPDPARPADRADPSGRRPGADAQADGHARGHADAHAGGHAEGPAEGQARAQPGAAGDAPAAAEARVAAAVALAVAAEGGQPGALLPVLHALQQHLGHVPDAAVPAVARALGLSRAEVHGVLSYYHAFRRQPPGRRVLQVCVGEACLACGGAELAAAAERAAGCRLGQTRADGALSLEPVVCLGLCASAPAAQLDSQPLARLAPDALGPLLAPARQAGEGAERAPDGPTATGQVGADAGVALSRGAAAADAMPRSLRLWLSADTAARAAGADAVAAALQAQAAADGTALVLIRHSSRGLLWLEPLLELDTPAGRVGHGPLTPQDVPGLWPLLRAEAARPGPPEPAVPGHPPPAPSGPAHPLRVGLVEQLPWLARQQRVLFRRAGRLDPLSLVDHAAQGGWAGLQAAAALAPAQVVQQVLDSGLRGRGGAAFPAGVKWRTVAAAAPAPGPQGGAALKYVVCNADEGDSGAFADRLLMEGDPYTLVEGMAIAGLAVGATQGIVYIRHEYPQAVATMRQAIARATAAGWLGPDVAGSGRAFHLQVRVAAGAYVCGEETAMLESIEGRRGTVRAKPPLPALAGLFGAPTLVHNVLTLAAVPAILAQGGTACADLGCGRSRGSMPFQLAGNVRFGGLVELPFGVTLRELVFGFGGGSRSGRPVKAIQVGGPLGAYVPPALWDLPLDYEAYAAHGLVLGHGGIVVHDDTADLAALARQAMAFCAAESCGKCTPCRIGATRGVEVIDRLRAAPAGAAGQAQRARQQALLRDLCDTLLHGSLCAMGGMTPYPVLSALDHYPEDFERAPQAVAHPPQGAGPTALAPAQPQASAP